MAILAGAIGARSAVEVGTFTGYSALCAGARVARRRPAAVLRRERTMDQRRAPLLERAGVANKITLKLGPAADTLKALPASHTFDFAFIDADKTSYAIYYEEILKRLRPSGLILIDNVLWNGAIIDETKQEADTLALRKLNDFIASDTRVEAVMLGIADGLTIVRKK